MAQFLDTTGLSTLWNKIKSNFVEKTTRGGIELTGEIAINTTAALAKRSLSITPTSINSSHNDNNETNKQGLYLNGPDLLIVSFPQLTTAEEGIKQLQNAAQAQLSNTIIAFGRVTGYYAGCSYIAILSNTTTSQNAYTCSIIVTGSDSLDEDYSGASGLFLRTAICSINDTGSITWY